MQLNSLGSGLRKLANEANEFVQELLMPPTMIDTEKAGENGLDLKQQCDVRIPASQKKKVKQPTGGSVNLIDDTCNKITTIGRLVFWLSWVQVAFWLRTV